MTEVARASLVVGEDGRPRCAWVGADAEYERYHDEEWGVPLRGDRALFEKISLEAFQSGLSWITILKRRPGFRAVFHDFAPARVASFSDAEIEAAMQNPAIIRNRAKVLATVHNAAVVHSMVESEPGALDALVWSFVPEPSQPRPRALEEIAAVTPESIALSKALKHRGFKFVGPTTMYALMQSAGLVDDHVEGCWRAR
ncbi:DNA-3-methyladenine glycosylase I [Humidisolicoccus flavus]|uniref:DNA-3-methyladenine glycosylase I n=1 Tax=Humidisolicoccus flavus TaxID=3111414 RepID=UPI00324E7DAA